MFEKNQHAGSLHALPRPKAAAPAAGLGVLEGRTTVCVWAAGAAGCLGAWQKRAPDCFIVFGEIVDVLNYLQLSTSCHVIGFWFNSLLLFSCLFYYSQWSQNVSAVVAVLLVLCWYQFRGMCSSFKVAAQT